MPYFVRTTCPFPDAVYPRGSEKVHPGIRALNLLYPNAHSHCLNH